ncbi:MAG: hypothetical protein AAF211_18260, partial [Myxococcota bacterium]
MYVTELRVEGLRHVPGELTELSRVVRLPSGPSGVAVADALTLFAVGLATAPRPGLAALAWGRTLEWIGEGPVEVHGLAPHAVGAAVDPEFAGVKIEAFLALDPPLYGRLRAAAVRDPRVAAGLGEDPVLALKVGWLFNGDRTVMTPSLLGARLGDRPFETAGAERPAWLPDLVRDVAGRFVRTGPADPPATARLHDAVLHPAESAGRRALAALAEEPWSFPAARFARVAGGLEVVFGETPLRGHQFGRQAA